MQEYYKILGLSVDASEEEIENAYRTLKDKYSRERFYEGEIGNEAARNLTKVETAYHEIMSSKKKVQDEEVVNDYSEVEKLIKSGNINMAQEKLDNFSERNADWHYLQSVIFYKKNWLNESKKQLEIALNIEPYNSKYSDALTKLKQKMEYNDRQYQGSYNQNTQQPQYDRQMGGVDSNNCLSFCATWCCMDMLCSICCR
jgi:curved DNA-binding protein CbpA